MWIFVVYSTYQFQSCSSRVLFFMPVSLSALECTWKLQKIHLVRADTYALLDLSTENFILNGLVQKIARAPVTEEIVASDFSGHISSTIIHTITWLYQKSYCRHGQILKRQPYYGMDHTEISTTPRKKLYQNNNKTRSRTDYGHLQKNIFFTL
jgi:hypothetical protein